MVDIVQMNESVFNLQGNNFAAWFSVNKMAGYSGKAVVPDADICRSCFTVLVNEYAEILKDLR
jgi:hypothetical protein